MINKLRNLSLLFVALFFVGLTNVEAKVFTPEEIEELSTFEMGELTGQENIYIFGSHVYFNSITMGQLVEAANTLGGQTGAKLYYKDGTGAWKNGVTKTEIPVQELENLEFDVTKIEVEGTFDESATEVAGENPTTVGNKQVMTFPLETYDVVALKSISLASTPSTFTGIDKQHHEYNQNAVTVNFNENTKTITVKGKSPLLTREGLPRVDVLVDIGSAPDTYKVCDQEIPSNCVDYSTVLLNFEPIDKGMRFDLIQNKQSADYLTKYGATGTEFVGSLPLGESASYLLTIKKYNSEGRVVANNLYTLVYESVKHIDNITINSDDAEDAPQEVVSLTNGVAITKYKALADTSNYVSDYVVSIADGVDKPAEYRYTVDGVEYVAKAHDNEIHSYNHYQEKLDLVSVKAGNAVELDNDTEVHAFNQSAITVAKEETGTTGDYTATISLSKMPKTYTNGAGAGKWIALLVDFGATPFTGSDELVANITTGAEEVGYEIEEIDFTDATRHGASSDTEFVMWINIDRIDEVDGLTYKFQTVESAGDDTMTIKFVLEDNIPATEVTNVKVADYVALGTDTAINEKYQYNLGSISTDLEYDEKNSSYIITVTENRDMKEFVGGNSEFAKEWYGLIINTNTLASNLTGAGYSIEEIDYQDAQRHGASANNGNEFVMWLKGGEVDEQNFLEFTNEVTNTVTKVQVRFVSVTEFEYSGEETVIYNKEFTVDTPEVTYNTERGSFVIRGHMIPIDEINITVEGTDKYTFVLEDGVWKAPVKNLKIANAYAGLALDEYGEDQKYNQNAIESVVVNENNINVTFNTTLATYTANETSGKWFSIVVDLGVDSDKVTTATGYSIEESDRTDANRHVATTNASDNNIVLWVNASDLTDDKKEITFKNTDNEDITLTVNIVPTEENTLSLVGAKKAIIAPELSEEDYYTEMVYNQDSIESVLINQAGEIVVTASRDLNNYQNSSTATERWYAILVDLDVLASKLSTKAGYSINVADKTDAVRFGGTGNEVILWLRAGNAEKTITFTNTDENAKYDELTVKVKTVVPALEVENVKVADYDVIGAAEINTLYEYNQGSISTDLEYDEQNLKYILTVSENRDMKEFIGGNAVEAKEWFGLVVDTNALASHLNGTGYSIDELDYKDALRHGASANNESEFVMWLTGGDSDYTKTISFSNGLSEITIDIKFESVSEFAYGEEQTSVIYNKDFTISNENVTYDSLRRVFLVRGTSPVVEEFNIVVEENDEYVFIKKDGIWQAPVKILKIANAYAGLALDEYNEAQKYNQDSIESVVVDGNDINVTFKRELATYNTNSTDGKWFSIVVDLGVDSDKVTTAIGYSIEEVDKTDANRHVVTTNASDNNIVLWININSIIEGDKTIIFKNTDNEEVALEAHIIPREKNSLSLVSARKAVISPEMAEDDYYAEMVANQAAIESVVIENDAIIVTTNGELASYTNSSSLNKKWYAILVDLDIASADLDATSGYTIEEADKTTAARLGGTGNEIVLWLQADTAGRNITFVNTDDEAKYDNLEVEILVDPLTRD